MSRRRQLPRKDFHTLRRDLLAARSLFVDPDFPPDERSLHFDGKTPKDLSYRIVWKRPMDIVRNPRFVISGVSHHDLDQGNLGDCWFVAATAVLAASNPKQFKRVVPFDQDFDEDYAGIFYFNFWWYGEWVEVIIDDFLPTDGRGLVYLSNNENRSEFWPALLEKAYAKLRGCYDAINGGFIQDALVDFTGGISEVVDLRDKKKDSDKKHLYEILQTSYRMNSMIGASISRTQNASRPEVRIENGLYQGHAYSIIGFAQVRHARGVSNLICLRNPWGQGEWTGPWSDRSPEMKHLDPYYKEKLNMRRREDGEFWMAYENFFENFDRVQLCHLQPDALTDEISADEGKQRWNVQVYHDAWIKGVTAGGCTNHGKLFWRNPQFFVTLKDCDDNPRDGKCTLIVSLIEKEKDNKSTISIGFTIYKLKNPDYTPLDEDRAPRNALQFTDSSGNFRSYREVSERFELPPGVYVIIPSTFYPHREAEFMLRIFTEKKVEGGVLDIEPGPEKPIRPPEDTVAVLFAKHAGRDKKMDAHELRAFLIEASASDIKEKLDFNLEVCRSLLAMMDRNKSGYLDLDEAKTMWREVKTYRVSGNSYCDTPE